MDRWRLGWLDVQHLEVIGNSSRVEGHGLNSCTRFWAHELVRGLLVQGNAERTCVPIVVTVFEELNGLKLCLSCW